MSLGGAAVVAALLAVAPVAPAGATGTIPTPSQDSFYRYTGSAPLSHVAPGTVLKTRPVQIDLDTSPTPVEGEQLLYRTTGQLGQPTVTVTTVLTPTSAAAAPRLVEYLSFYDGLDSKCDPSYTLRGGYPDETDEEQAEEEELLLSWYLAHGLTVTIPDFEGTNMDWMAGDESGYGALDAVRATESYLHLAAATTPVGLGGYSGGSVAANWAAELAPAYAPKVDLVAVAEGGIPVNYAHIFSYINGNDEFSPAIPGILLGLAHAYRVDLTPYLSAYGAKVVAEEADTCIAADFGNYPGLTIAKLMKPKYADLTGVPVIKRMLSDQIMGTAPGRPSKSAVLMGVGNVDGTGDGVMIDADVKALAHHYCSEGVPVEFQEYQGAAHEYAGVYFEPIAGAFLQARLDGVPFVNNCSSD